MDVPLAVRMAIALTDAVGPDEVSVDAGVDIMAGVQQELARFIEDVARGRA